MKWQRGRQGDGYDKFCLYSNLTLKCDCYIIKYYDGASLGIHKDPIEQGRHFRLNIVVKKPKSGGKFTGNYIFKLGRVMLLRPDIDSHGVTKCHGERIVLSFGWIW